jgi:hypothetical protein
VALHGCATVLSETRSELGITKNSKRRGRDAGGRVRRDEEARDAVEDRVGDATHVRADRRNSSCSGFDVGDAESFDLIVRQDFTGGQEKEIRLRVHSRKLFLVDVAGEPHVPKYANVTSELFESGEIGAAANDNVCRVRMNREDGGQRLDDRVDALPRNEARDREQDGRPAGVALGGPECGAR